MTKLVPVDKTPVTHLGAFIDTRYIDQLQAVYETIGGKIVAGIIQVAMEGVKEGMEVTVDLDRQWINWQIIDRMRKDEEPCRSVTD